jgi:hypothetical protein
MLGVNPRLHDSLNEARETYNLNQIMEKSRANRAQVGRLIDTEWIPLANEVANQSLPDEPRDDNGNYLFYSGWATISKHLEEDGSLLQAQIKKTVPHDGGMGTSMVEIYLRLVDEEQEDIVSAAERAILISCTDTEINRVGGTAEICYEVLPEDESIWNSMLESLEQLKKAEFPKQLSLA